jgi:hypothetical protein
MALERRCFKDPFGMPAAQELSVWIGVGGWGWPMSWSLCAEPSSFFSIVKQSTEIRFSGRGDDHFHDRTWDMDTAIDWWWIGVAVNGGGVMWGTGA